MAKPNYSFEKRQKEIAKKKKQEEKRLRKSTAHGEQTPGEQTGNEHTPEATPKPPVEDATSV